MDLRQHKLTKEEWVDIERPVSNDEEQIIQLIMDGYLNVSVTSKDSLTLLRYLKVNKNDNIDKLLFVRYLQPSIKKLFKKYDISYKEVKAKDKTIKKADLIRLSNADRNISKYEKDIYEFVLIDLFSNLLKYEKLKNPKWMKYYYIISILLERELDGNQTISDVLSSYISTMYNDITFHNSLEYICASLEKCSELNKFTEKSLYHHQRKLMTIAKKPGSKFITYMAPTGTGKTLSPLGLLVGNKVLFVCAARHVGLALAKAAISVKRKIAFAFGCECSDDIRLHYFAAKEYTRNKRTGGIAKVDNSVGEDVEMVISDVKSYLHAMRYMLAFNKASDIIVYWDEPTISLDYLDHEFHSMIKNNWCNNEIPNMILSSATLPPMNTILDTVMDFKAKFVDATSYSIESHEYSRSVKLLNTEGEIVLPHTLAKDYYDLQEILLRCERYPILMRYMDIEMVRYFLLKVFQSGIIIDNCDPDDYFPSVTSITVQNIKEFYLRVLKSLSRTQWEEISREIMIPNKVKNPYKSTIHLVTCDAKTITDGPAIFLTSDVTKIGQFYLKEANMPTSVIEGLVATIRYNDMVNRKILVLEKKLEDIVGDECIKESVKRNPEVKDLMEKIENFKLTIRSVLIPSLYIPNSREHLQRFVLSDEKSDDSTFTSDISESIVEEVMMIPDIEDTWKVLLLLGVGVFTNHSSLRYLEIMRRLAVQQKLFVIIASGDYIYGTNYQFCHGYIGKDLATMSQEKCIQAMGRIGRGQQNKSYTIRFRNNDLINRIFHEEKTKLEIENMKKLFNGLVTHCDPEPCEQVPCDPEPCDTNV